MFNILKFLTHRKTADITRTPHAPAPAGHDSHPVNFRGVDIGKIHEQQRKWLDYYQVMDGIDVETLSTCLDECTQGAYARQQWIWEQLEPVDGYLSICVERRIRALSKYNPKCSAKPHLEDTDQVLAESQARTINDLLTSIRNMPEAITSLGMASLRHYKFLQPYEDSKGLHLLPVDNWLMCRDGYRGEWRFNPRAQFGRTIGEELPVPYEGLIKRICPRPIDLPAQMRCLNRKTTLAQWDVFLGRYGTPPMFLVMPDGISEELREMYIRAAEMCVSNAAGALPNGTTLLSPTVPATSVELFDRRLKVANEEIVLLNTGGKLTMMAESGAGTLAGNAHADVWDDIISGEAEDISAVLTEQLVDSILDQYHPGQPHLVELVLVRKDLDDLDEMDKEIDNVAKLRASGYELDVEEVSSRTGWQVTKGVNPPSIYEARAAGYVPTQGAISELMGMPVQPAPVEGVVPGVAGGSASPAVPHRAAPPRRSMIQPRPGSLEGLSPWHLNRRRDSLLRTWAIHRRSTLYAPAAQTLEQTVMHRLEDIDAQLVRLADEDDLLAQVRALITPPSMEDILRDAARIAPGVKSAVAEGKARAAAIDSQQP